MRNVDSLGKKKKTGRTAYAYQQNQEVILHPLSTYTLIRPDREKKLFPVAAQPKWTKTYLSSLSYDRSFEVKSSHNDTDKAYLAQNLYPEKSIRCQTPERSNEAWHTHVIRSVHSRDSPKRKTSSGTSKNIGIQM